MHANVNQYKKTCDRCQRAKRNYNPNKPPLPHVGRFHRWHVDILGPLSKTPQGFEHVLVVVDSFTRWTEAFPMKEHKQRYYDPNIHRKRFEVQPQQNNAPAQNANVAPQAQPQVQEEPENTADNAEPLEEPPNENIQPENDVNQENVTENYTNQPHIEQQSFNFQQIKRGKFCNGKRYMRVEWLDKIRTWEPDSSFDPPMLEEINLRFTQKGKRKKSFFKRVKK
ncbi:unnamed protein product [Mytilus edulis]|uniref:Uncharacterized protein n=1 Tax=Mytilus edulis TaxID=6550 RepID=A0A8S3TFV3_MYTED|nr:unnamed protein product [Mytilus edulis]